MKALEAPAREIAALMRDEAGNALWEYALLICIGLSVAATLFLLKDKIKAVFGKATAELTW